MSACVYISEDDDLKNDDVLWENNTHIFNNIFKRTASFFRHFEINEKKECFQHKGYGLAGIDLTTISKKTFNIFCLRFKEAYLAYPDIHEIYFQNGLSEEYKNHDKYIISEWKFILNMLEKDNRYDSEWIKEYQIKTVMQDCMNL